MELKVKTLEIIRERWLLGLDLGFCASLFVVQGSLEQGQMEEFECYLRDNSPKALWKADYKVGFIDDTYHWRWKPGNMKPRTNWINKHIQILSQG